MTAFVIRPCLFEAKVLSAFSSFVRGSKAPHNGEDSFRIHSLLYPSFRYNVRVPTVLESIAFDNHCPSQ